jgi:Leucine-rich repeat (LRR) protein
MVNAQDWLDNNYPKETRKEIKKLNINRNNLEGYLNLNGFLNLEKLDCSNNKITSLDLSSSTRLEEVYCYFNEINKMYFAKSNQLRIFDAGYNLLLNLHNDHL